MSDNQGYKSPYNWHHELIERRGALMAVLTTVGISIGGLVEIVPMYSAGLGVEPMEGVTPYSPLEVAGRDIYVREGCYNCHSQMVRPFRAEYLRYGEWTRAGELVYDRPFQLGSRRIGPDLARVGTKYKDAAWHYEHMLDPRATSPGSLMPPYPWLYDSKVDPDDITASLTALQTLGAPYTDADVSGVAASMAAQGKKITDRLAAKNFSAAPDHEIIALIAYLEKLGVEGTAAIEAAGAAGAGSGS